MSNQVNFRAWRDVNRQKRTKSYIEVNVFVVVFVVLILICVNMFGMSMVSTQKTKNDYLKSEDVVLSEKLSEIGEYEETLKEITERMKVINDLQADRINAVLILDEIAQLTPKDIKLTTVKRESGFIVIEGVAVKQITISKYLKNLSESDYVSNPRLERVISAEKENGFERSQFFIKATETIILE